MATAPTRLLIGDRSPTILSALLTTTYESSDAWPSRQATTGKRLGDIGCRCSDPLRRPVATASSRTWWVTALAASLHEDPQVPNFGRTGSGRKLKTGLTVCVEPMINRGTASVRTEGDGWTVKTADSLPSAHYEHMIAVRPGEADVLTTFRYIEEALDVLPYELTTSVA